MTNTANIQPQPSLGFGIEPLRAKWGWIVALGVVYLIVGVIALGSIVLATAASVFLVGIMMVIAGVAEIINAFQIKTWGRFLLWLVLGALYVFAGFVAFSNPLLTAVVLTLLLGAALVVSGIMRIVLALRRRHAAPGPYHSGTLAVLEPVCSRTLFLASTSSSPGQAGWPSAWD